MLDAIGWIATAVFSCSYFCRRSRELKWIQAVAAVIWVAYGSIIHAMPVVAANLIVALAAVASSIYKPPKRGGTEATCVSSPQQHTELAISNGHE